MVEQLLRLKYTKTAEEVANEALERTPGDPLLIVASADVLRSKGDYTAANSKYEEALRRNDFDPLDSWYLYFVKPVIGATLGLLFGLAVELGLITFAGEVKEDKRAISLVVLAGMAGLFAENVHHRLEALLKPK